MRHILPALLFVSAVLLAPAQELQTLHIQHNEVPELKTGADWKVKNVVLRRAFSHDPKHWRFAEYSRVEIWISNLDVDFCALPEISEVTSLPLNSPDDYVLLYQGLQQAGKKSSYTDTPLSQTDFAGQWPQSHGRPVVHIWATVGHGYDIYKKLRELFPQQSLEFVMGPEREFVEYLLYPEGKKLKSLNDIDRSTLLELREGTQGRWWLFRQGLKHPRQDIGATGFAFLQPVENGTLFTVEKHETLAFGTPKVPITGKLRITKVCPAYSQDKKTVDGVKIGE